VTTLSFRELPARLRNNLHNVLVHGASTVPLRRRRHAEVWADACAVIDLVRNAGGDLGPARRAVVAGPPSYDWLLAALACLFTGTELVALPETLGEADAAASLRGLPVDLVLADAPIATFACLADRPRVGLQGLARRAEAHHGPAIDVAPPASLVAFTSGSTSGAALKSFRVDLRSTAAFIEAFTAQFDLHHDDCWLVCHSFSHIVHLEYVLGGLLWGYDVAIVDVLRLLMNGAELRPSAVVTVPSVYEQLAQRIRRMQAKRGTPSPAPADAASPERRPLSPEAIAVVGDRIKVMVIGAAPSAAPLQRFLLDAGLPLYEGYGMSENFAYSHTNRPGDVRVGTVGRVAPGVEQRIDDNGEILVRSPSTMMGYFKDPEQTSAATSTEFSSSAATAACTCGVVRSPPSCRAWSMAAPAR